MPRSLGVFIEGGIYHVYNRFASGEPHTWCHLVPGTDFRMISVLIIYPARL